MNRGRIHRRGVGRAGGILAAALGLAGGLVYTLAAQRGEPTPVANNSAEWDGKCPSLAPYMPLVPATSPLAVIYEDVSDRPADPGLRQTITAYDKAGVKIEGGRHPRNHRHVGFPYTIVRAGQRPAQVRFTKYDKLSDHVSYPIPDDAPVEDAPYAPPNGGDHHLLVFCPETHRLYELWKADRLGPGSWRAQIGVVFNLQSGRLRPEGRPSADVAGLPILPLLIHGWEVFDQGEIKHALRVTFPFLRKAYYHPAVNSQWNPKPTWIPAGARIRLRRDYDVSGFSKTNQIILNALKHYGAYVADGGQAYGFSCATDPRWDEKDLARLRDVKGPDFEVVKPSGPLIPLR